VLEIALILYTLLYLCSIMLNLFCPQGMKVVELSDDPRSLSPIAVLPSVNYQIINADYLLLRDTRQDVMDNSSLRAQRQPQSYGPMSLEQSIPLHMIHTGPRIQPFILARQVRSSTPALYVLFYATGNREDMSEGPMQNIPGQNERGYLCVTAHSFWESREVRDSCSISADGGFCLVHLKPEPAWFNPGGGRSSWEQRGDQRGNVAELYYQIRPSPSGQCVPQESKIRRGPQHGDLGRQIYGTSMKRIGTVNLLRSPPGNPTFMRLRLGGAVIIQMSSKPLKTTDTATFYVFLSSTSPSDANLWDITLEPGRGSDAQTITVTCQKKSTFTSLLEVLQMDFETEEQSDQLESQMITWRLELPGNMIRDEGTMRIYTIQRDYVGIAPLITDTELLNTAVLTGKKVSVPVKVLGVEADGSITDITNSSRCRSSDQDVLKVSERCDSVYVNGKETRGRVRMMVNFTYSYLSTQLEVSVWMPRVPLHMEVSDSELSQIKAWRVPVTGNKKVSWDTEEEDERKGRGCMLQYQHSLIRVLRVFTAESPDPSSPSPAYFLGSDWQVDVTRLVRYFLRVGDTSVARLNDAMLGLVSVVHVMSPLSNSVLAERMIRILDDKVSITELGVQLVSGLSLNLQLSPGSNRAIIAKTTTQEIIHYPKQVIHVATWAVTLTISSLDPRVASVREIPESVFVVVAEAEGQGLLLRAELAICEACQKSKRKSKLAVGGGMVKVKFPPDEQFAGTGKKEIERASDDEEADNVSKSILTSPLNTLQHTVIQESFTNAIKTATNSNLQEAIGGGVSTIKSINTMDKTLITKPVADRALVTVGPRSPIKNGYGNLLEKSNFPFPPEEPKQEPPLVESNLIQMFSVFTDIEVCIYALVGLSCLIIIAVLLHCATNSARSRNKKSPVQCQGQSEHKHHWVRLGTAAEQNRAAPIATTSKQVIRDAMAPLPPMAVRSATLLARPIRSEPLHSPTSKRNQVQFTTFTTLDIKHLAALKKSGQNFSWASQPVGGCQAASISQDGLNGKKLVYCFIMNPLLCF
uniref:Si:dkey-1d7.3 n=1 Tax=Sinocyclocheilus anshuiensis TaxID=1608454 RepID=A0A671RAP8_9TELE